MGRHDVLVLERPETVIRTARWPELRSWSQGALTLQKALNVPARTTEVVFGQTRATVTLPANVATADPDIWAEVRFGAHCYQIAMQTAALNALIATQGFSDTVEALEPAVTPLVIEHLLSDLIAPLEKSLGGAFQITDIGPANTVADTALRIHFALPDDTAFSLHVAGTPEDMTHLTSQLIDASPSQPGVSDANIPMVVRLMGPRFRLAQREIDACQAGDGLMIDLDWSALNDLSLHVQSDLCARVRRHDGTVTLASALSSPADPQTTGSPDMNHVADIETAPKQSVTDALGVTVTIVVDEVTMSVADLQALREGDALPFADALTTDVALLANGKPFARGDLIRIDDKVAVRLTRID